MCNQDLFSDINDILARYAKSIPADGTHIAYLRKGSKLLAMYGEASAILEKDIISAEEQAKLNAISNKISEIV